MALMVITTSRGTDSKYETTACRNGNAGQSADPWLGWSTIGG